MKKITFITVVIITLIYGCLNDDSNNHLKEYDRKLREKQVFDSIQTTEIDSIL